MDQRASSKEDSSSANHDISNILWNEKVHCVHNRLIHIPTLSQINPHNNLPLYLFKTYFDVTLPSVSRHPTGLTLYVLLSYSLNATCPAHVILLDLSLTHLLMQFSPVSWCFLPLRPCIIFHNMFVSYSEEM
jgi:hypothetical protein